MNDQQEDELLALSAIYPDLISWRTLLDANSDQVVEVKIRVEIDWDEERDVHVWDWMPPPPPPPPPGSSAKASGCPVRQQGVVDQLESISLSSSEPSRQPTASTRHPDGQRQGSGSERPLQLINGGATRGRGRRGRGRGSKSVEVQPTNAGAPQPRQTDTARPSARQDQPPRSPPVHVNHLTQPLVAPPPPTQSSLLKFVPARPSTPPPLPPSRPPPEEHAATEDRRQSTKLKLQYLPPLEVIARLPQSYPIETGPSHVQLVDQVGWLSTEWRTELESRMKSFWAGDECLYGLVDLVAGASLIPTLNLSFPIVLRQPAPHSHQTRRPVSPPPPTTSSLSAALSAHNAAIAHARFTSTTFACALCLSTTLKGSSCVMLDACSHVFCRQCLVDYFALLIKEGLVRGVACPGEECTRLRGAAEKEEAAAAAAADRGGGGGGGGAGGVDTPVKDLKRAGEVGEDELERIVGRELRERYVWLKEKQRVEADPSIAFCPRSTCRAAVPRPPSESKSYSDSDKLRICPVCSHSFCVICLRTWHGPRNPCSLPQSSLIVQTWLEGDDEARALLEKRYGRANVVRMVRVAEEERVNRQWMDEHSRKCPGCDARIEKSQGCAHMQCARCGTHFCYVCEHTLSALDPYKHFSTPGSSCYNKLFDFRPGAEPPMEEWIGQVLQEEVVAADDEWHEQGWNPFL